MSDPPMKDGKYQKEYFPGTENMPSDEYMENYKDKKSTDQVDFYDWAAVKRWVPDLVQAADAKLPKHRRRLLPYEVMELEQQKEEVEAAINPDHYKDVVPGYQYSQLMYYLLQGRDPYVAHLMGNVYKYMFRLGKKDAVDQEVGKALWYLTALDLYLRGEKNPDGSPKLPDEGG